MGADQNSAELYRLLSASPSSRFLSDTSVSIAPPPIANGHFPTEKSSTERMTIQRQNAPMLPQCAFSGFLPHTAG